jgi:two-component system CheB/CheR fusion protein
LQESLSQDRPVRDFEMTHEFPTIGEKVMILNARRVVGKQTRGELILLAIEDITERMDALRGSDLRKSDFLSMLAHELRNPLAPIRNAVRLLRDNDLEKGNELQYDTIDRQVNKLVRLVDDVLDMTRFTRGNVVIRKEAMDLIEVVNNAIDGSRAYFSERRHNLVISLPPEPILVDGDSTRLEQAVGNLLNNAAKFTDPGGEIRITMERRKSEVVLSARDNGIGIPRETLPNIFEIFFQADRSLDRSRGGIGVGLA